jgi:hypothetical protein
MCVREGQGAGCTLLGGVMDADVCLVWMCGSDKAGEDGCVDGGFLHKLPHLLVRRVGLAGGQMGRAWGAVFCRCATTIE